MRINFPHDAIISAGQIKTSYVFVALPQDLDQDQEFVLELVEDPETGEIRVMVKPSADGEPAECVWSYLHEA